MRLFAVALMSLVLFSSGSVFAKGVKYTLVPEQTKIRFSTKMCEADLLIGDFQDIKGDFYFDEEKPEESYVNVTIAAAKATYNKQMHKDHLIKDVIDSDKILNVEKFPTVTFKSTKVVKTSDITADVTGDMTLLGVTSPFTMEVTFHNDVGMAEDGRQVASFSAYGTFDRTKYGVLYGMDRVGIRKMGKDIMVFITASGLRDDLVTKP